VTGGDAKGAAVQKLRQKLLASLGRKKRDNQQIGRLEGPRFHAPRRVAVDL